MNNRHIYSKKQDQFLIDNVKGITLKELTERFNKKFNLTLSESSIANRKNKLRISSGIKGGQFEKGHIPINKGTKGMFNVGGNKTSFKKGSVPHNSVPIGTEKWKKYGGSDKDKYLFVKIQDGHLNNNWKAKHILVYEQHYGPVPKGYKVIFADGDRTNFNIDNLIMVSYSEQLIMNQNGFFKKNKELTKTGATIAKVIDKTNKLRKK